MKRKGRGEEEEVENVRRGAEVCVSRRLLWQWVGGHMTERSEGAGCSPSAADKHKQRGTAWLVSRDNRTDVSARLHQIWVGNALLPVAMATERGATWREPVGRRLWRAPRACVSPADQRGDDDAPGGAAAVGAGLLRVRVAVRGVVALAPPTAEPEGVEEEEEEVQGQAQQRHGAEQQNGLWRHTHTKKKNHTQFQPSGRDFT